MQNTKRDNELLAMARQAIDKAQAKSLTKDLNDDDLNIANSTQKNNLVLKMDLEKSNIDISKKLKDNIETMQDLLDDILIELDSNDAEIAVLSADAKNAISLLKVKNPQLASSLENTISVKKRKKTKIINKQRM
ncbi:hypothetical protein ACU5B6_13090 [Moritella viscosa]|uniref:hypothetical protein n=1 Tax=Moritella viscosa TaxID=80854 RepID=UPI000922C962|nr:hypothetical protein [Moritella viscosa]SHO15744.1 Chaperone protein htpG-Heat shock protein htpG-High temperature protein G [Moritella viscosa]SHO16095.1 Chaperone protein htpG-Heat shock protein htpG-High temperature protein G [Moritella viscosa]SHO18822.1 Chaperone protein htpG-Heat shock protein htpG-High temperature protein G [Moritella viscosa]